jgi:biopolymer transport protein TolQ
MIELIKITDLVTKFVLIMLVFFSAFSWAIVLYKYFYLKRCKKNMLKFSFDFYKLEDLKKIFEHAVKNSHNSFSILLLKCFPEIKMLSESKKKLDVRLEFENVLNSVKKAHNAELLELKKHVHYLATIASVSPFIGLFGTVWGIMNSFQSINPSGSISLATIAPGISGALITTVFGLAAAIPALIFYNFLNLKIKKINVEIFKLKEDFLGILKRKMTSDSFLGSLS